MGVGVGVEKEGDTHRHTHAETRTGPEARDRSGQVADDRKRVLFCFFDPITGDVHRGGNDCSPVE